MGNYKTDPYGFKVGQYPLSKGEHSPSYALDVPVCLFGRANYMRFEHLRKWLKIVHRLNIWAKHIQNTVPQSKNPLASLHALFQIDYLNPTCSPIGIAWISESFENLFP